MQEFMKRHHVERVVTADRIMGCPHEEGIDYPKGEVCPCGFLKGRWRPQGAGGA